MGRRKGPDEVFCTACGARIKEAAELCPECGVRNRAAGATWSSTNAATRTGSDERGLGEPTVSDGWWYGVAACLAMWIILLVAGAAAIEPFDGALGGLLVLLAWVGLPLSAYFDMKYVRRNSDWQPNTGLWVVGLLVWILNIVLGAVYLYRRHEALGTP